MIRIRRVEIVINIIRIDVLYYLQLYQVILERFLVFQEHDGGQPKINQASTQRHVRIFRKHLILKKLMLPSFEVIDVYGVYPQLYQKWAVTLNYILQLIYFTQMLFYWLKILKVWLFLLSRINVCMSYNINSVLTLVFLRILLIFNFLVQWLLSQQGNWESNFNNGILDSYLCLSDRHHSI